MGTIKHPVPNRVKPSFVFFDIRTGSLTLSSERQSARISKIANDGLARYDTAVPYGNSGRQC